MSVAEVRRGLDAVRTQWHQGAPRFYFTEKLFNGMTVQEFCTKFTLGHHTKRHAKSKRGGGDNDSLSDRTNSTQAEAPASPPATRSRKRQRR